MASGRPGVGSRAQKGTRQALIAQSLAWKDRLDEFRLSPQFSLRIYERAGRLMTKVTGQSVDWRIDIDRAVCALSEPQRHPLRTRAGLPRPDRRRCCKDAAA